MWNILGSINGNLTELLSESQKYLFHVAQTQH